MCIHRTISTAHTHFLTRLELHSFLKLLTAVTINILKNAIIMIAFFSVHIEEFFWQFHLIRYPDIVYRVEFVLPGHRFS